MNKVNEEEQLCAPIASVLRIERETEDNDDDDDQGQKASDFTPMIGNRGRDDMKQMSKCPRVT